jgi:hypothetical protein
MAEIAHLFKIKIKIKIKIRMMTTAILAGAILTTREILNRQPAPRGRKATKIRVASRWPLRAG